MGIDGATFDIILPGINNGYLPNFDKLVNGGVWGNLNSTIPPISAPAWSSFMTGKNPGKHGIYSWTPLTQNYREDLVTSRTLKGSCIWEYLSDEGKLSGLYNIPNTFPPSPIKGFMITGLMTPSREEQYTYPPDLKHELDKHTNFHLEPQNQPDLPDAQFYDHMQNFLRMQFEVIKYLINKKQSDFFCAVLRPEPVNHRFWTNKNKEEVIKSYRLLDKIIGDLLGLIDDDTNLIIISDHGFGRIDSVTFNGNEWLCRKGWLKLKREGTAIPKRFLRPDKLLEVAATLGAKDLINRVVPKKSRSVFNLSLKNIDWKRTKAIFRTTASGFDLIYINSKDRFKDGIVGNIEYRDLVNQIISDLKELRHNQQSVVKKVWRREEIYEGPYVNQAPDLIVSYESGFRGGKRMGSNFKDYHSGVTTGAVHSFKGIFIGYGPDIKEDKLNDFNLVDIAPTALHMLGNPIPTDMDGKVLQIFNQSSDLRREPNYRKPLTSTLSSTKISEKEASEEVKEKLKDLGYLD